MIWLSRILRGSKGRATGRGATPGGEQEAGYTLLEMMVVLLVLAMLASIAVPMVFNQLGKAKSRTARIQIEALTAQLDFFRLDMDRFPTTEEGLGSLLRAPAGLNGWGGPYVRKEANIIDPWGTPYGYRSPGEHGEFDLFTLGSDGAEGGDGEAADVVNWD